MVKVQSLPKSALGESPRRPSWYAAGMPDVKTSPREPAAVAADCTQTFSFGPKYPPPAHVGRVFERGFRMAKPKIEPKSEAPNVHPVFNPR